MRTAPGQGTAYADFASALPQGSRTLPSMTKSELIAALAERQKHLAFADVELAVRNVIHGEPVKNLTALANPEALDEYRALRAELERA